MQSKLVKDSAASAQKPGQVLDAMRFCYENEYANVHRGLYELSEKATTNFETARKKVCEFIGAGSEREIIFTRGATDSINLAAGTWGASNLKEGDEIILSVAEHHSNIVPWQLLQRRIGFSIKAAPVADDGSFRMDEFRALLNAKTRFVGMTHMSNVLGSVFPVRDIVRAAHEVGAVVLIDGCQAVAHMPVDVREIGLYPPRPLRENEKPPAVYFLFRHPDGLIL